MTPGDTATTLPKRGTKFLIVGGICYLLSLGLMYVLTDLFGLHYLLSALAAFLLVSGVGYAGNRRYTYEDREVSFWRGLARYNTVMVSSLLLVLGLMFVLVDLLGVWYILANVLIAVGSTVYNFVLHHLWTYKDE